MQTGDLCGREEYYLVRLLTEDIVNAGNSDTTVQSLVNATTVVVSIVFTTEQKDRTDVYVYRAVSSNLHVMYQPLAEEVPLFT